MRYDFFVNRSTVVEIHKHLTGCAYEFTPPLHERVDLAAYSAKLAARAVLFEAWVDSTLIGLVAGYANAPDRLDSFVTNVSVLPEWHGQGIASRLLDTFVDHARASGFARVVLSVDSRNDRARSLYRKHGFIDGPGDGATQEMTFTLRTTQ